MNDRVQFVSSDPAAQMPGNVGVNLLELDARWTLRPGEVMPPWLDFVDGPFPTDLTFKENGVYVVTADLLANIHIVSRADPLMVKANGYLVYGMKWGGTAG